MAIKNIYAQAMTFMVPVAITLGAMQASAQSRMKTYCYMDPQGQVQGQNVDKLVEIASVSKVLVSHWAISKLGPEARIKTRFHVSQVGGGQVDVHIEGDFDPTFNTTRFALIAGHLNSLGIKSIRQLTFDEKFRFALAIYDSNAAISSDPSWVIKQDNEITPLLRHAVTNIGSIYSQAMASEAGKVNRAGYPAKAQLTVGNIEFKASADFSKGLISTQTYSTQSITIADILKKMNLKSNNYLANILFEHLGGPAKYLQFIKFSLGLDAKSISMLNGSGYPIKENGKRYDNLATCRSVVKVVKSLRDQMRQSGMAFADVIAVTGLEPSTLSGAYAGSLTNGSLIAKTGTADPVVALAGIASTQEGAISFAVMVADGRPGRASSGRVLIRQKVEEIIRKYGGASKISYEAESFYEMDNSAKLTLELPVRLM